MCCLTDVLLSPGSPLTRTSAFKNTIYLVSFFLHIGLSVKSKYLLVTKIIVQFTLLLFYQVEIHFSTPYSIYMEKYG